MVGSAWDQVMMSMYQTATERAIEEYDVVMNRLCFPIEEDDLKEHHIKAFKTSEKIFRQLTRLDSDRAAFDKHLEKLTVCLTIVKKKKAYSVLYICRKILSYIIMMVRFALVVVCIITAKRMSESLKNIVKNFLQTSELSILIQS